MRESDKLFYYGLAAAATVSIALVALVVLVLSWQSLPALQYYGLGLFSDKWGPSEEGPEASSYGLLVPLMGTLVTGALAVLMALPLSVSAALLVEEFLPQRLRGPFSLLVDVMAALPTIVYGLWGLRVLAPLLRDYVYKPLHAVLGWTPFFSCQPVTGSGVLTASILLAVMITPYMFAVVREAYHSIPSTYREAVLALGATRFEASRLLLSMIKPVLVAAALLGFGRAAGETVAVALVIGSAFNPPVCLFAPSYTVSALIANQFGEATFYPYMLNALYFGGLVLLALGLASNALGLYYLGRVKGVGES